MIIYNRNGVELIDVPITSSAVRKRVLMGDNYVSLPFSHDTYIDFAPGSYIIYNGLKFEIIDVDKNRPTRCHYRRLGLHTPVRRSGAPHDARHCILAIAKASGGGFP